MIRGSSLLLASILCFFCVLLSRYRAVGMRLNRVLTSLFEMRNGQLSPEGEALLPHFSLAPCGFSVRRREQKEKSARVLSQPVLEYQSSRLVFQRTAVLHWCRLVPGNCTTVEIKSWWSFSVTATNNVDRWRTSPDRRYRHFFPRDGKTTLLMREVSRGRYRLDGRLY